MQDFIPAIIIGLYTIIYLIVFFVQKSQIDKLKEVNSSMKSFMEIFNIDEIKKYIQLKEDHASLLAANTILDNQKFNDALKAVTTNNLEIAQAEYKEIKGIEHQEMIIFILKVLAKIPKEEREELINEGLPSCKHFFIPMINDPEFDEV